VQVIGLAREAVAGIALEEETKICTHPTESSSFVQNTMILNVFRETRLVRTGMKAFDVALFFWT